MKAQNLTKVSLLTLATALSFGFALSASADSNSYRMYNPNNGEHFWTIHGAEKESLMNSGWRAEGIGWALVDSGSQPIYRLYDTKTGNHFYTKNAYEKSSLQKSGYHYEGVYGYSAGTIPVYRLYNPHNGQHFWTANLNERASLKKLGYHDEGIAFYSVAPTYSWHYDTTESSQSGQVGDIHFPQFDYLTSEEIAVKTYQGNNVFYAYNDTAFNFNAQLQADAKAADYANAQARKNWSNQQSKDQLAVNNAKATLDTVSAKIAEIQKLITQTQDDITADQAHGNDSSQDEALLTQYQANLASAQTTYNADNTTYQTALSALNLINSQGTDKVQLSYTVSLTNSGKTVHVNFTKTMRTNGVNSTTNFSRSTTLDAD